MAALPDTRMPGVITLEVPTLPPSIGVVPSAVPCFIGYTEFANKNGADVTLKPVRIRNMREYEDYFGTTPDEKIDVDIREIVDDSATPQTLRVDIKVVSPKEFKFRMYYAMQLYYANGGGPCFIVSVGTQAAGTVGVAALKKGVDAAKLAKDVTIITFPDACRNMPDSDYYGDLIKTTLDHCAKMINRVVIVDVNDSYTDSSAITEQVRTLVPKNINLKYGAAYYPFLATTIDYKFDPQTVTIASHHAFNNLLLLQKQAIDSAKPRRELMKTLGDFAGASAAADLPALKKELELAASAQFQRLPKEVKEALTKDDATLATAKTDIAKLTGDYETAAVAKEKEFTDAQAALDEKVKDRLVFKNTPTLNTLEATDNLMFNKIKEAINAVPVVLPPGAAVAGLIVQTDATQGPWKAPANAGLGAVINPTVEIDDDFHAELNVDASSGKSINAIRTYEGKGILVFGARTLVGNDLEWRYVSVRRTFCFIEDSIARAMQDFIFAPNTRDTWIKVKAMISNFLVEIWKAGGLFGNSMNEAFLVHVGQPETMTDVDILEGRMIVEIKLRVARPAEFIILRYEHKFQANAA
jgi:phage tail sheath protein FI